MDFGASTERLRCSVMQMELTMLSPHSVRFRGPALSRMARGALSAASISVIDRQPAADWGGQLQHYLVSVEARDGEDAVVRVQDAVGLHGAYSGFTPHSP